MNKAEKEQLQSEIETLRDQREWLKRQRGQRAPKPPKREVPEVRPEEPKAQKSAWERFRDAFSGGNE